MTVLAECSDCGDVHPLEDRRLDEDHLAATCPACGSSSYETISDSERNTKSEADRIRDAISDVSGVGKKNLEAIVEEFSTLAELRAADVDRLEAIEGVGEKTAQAIVERLLPAAVEEEAEELIDGFRFVGDSEEGSA